MITPIRIGGLIIHFSNLCYSRELYGGKLVLMMTCGALHLEGDEAATVRAYLHKHSAEIGKSYKPKSGPELPLSQPPHNGARSVHNETTLLLDPPQRINR